MSNKELNTILQTVYDEENVGREVLMEVPTPLVQVPKEK